MYTADFYKADLFPRGHVSVKQSSSYACKNEVDGTSKSIEVDGKNFEFVKSVIVVAGRNDKKQCRN